MFNELTNAIKQIQPELSEIKSLLKDIKKLLEENAKSRSN
jgi:regulator of replication initiation timing